MLPRERSAWVWIAALLVVFGGYFAAIASLERASAEISFATRIAVLAVALTTLAVVVGIDRLFGWIRNRREASFLDERDRLIQLRSSSVAYYVLIVGMIIVGCVMPFGAGGWDIVHAALFAIVVAEVVHQGLIVIGYRLGWHAG